MFIDDENYESARDIFSNLVEFDLSYNTIDNEQDLIVCTEFISIQLIDITGNPLASKGEQHYSSLKSALHKNISCHLRIDPPKPEGTGAGLKPAALRKKVGHSLSLPSLK